MRTHKIPPLRGLFLLFILSVALLTVPDWARAHHEQLALAPSTTEMQEVVAEAPKTEGSKSKSTGHGSPKGMMGSPHGKTEGSGSKHGYGKGYSHGSKHGYGKKEGSHGRGYGKHGYSRYGYGGHGGHGKDPFRHVLRFAKPLGLTEAQIGQIKNMKFGGEVVDSIRETDWVGSPSFALRHGLVDRNFYPDSWLPNIWHIGGGLEFIPIINRGNFDWFRGLDYGIKLEYVVSIPNWGHEILRHELNIVLTMSH